MYICKFCNQEYKDKHAFSCHIKRSETHNFDAPTDIQRFLCDEFYGESKVDSLINQYIDEEICANDLSQHYKYVIKLIALMGIKRSNSEEKKTKRYKEKYQQTISKKYGEGIINVSQVPEVREKINQTIKHKNGSLKSYYTGQIKLMSDGYNIYCENDENLSIRQKKIEETMLRDYGVRNAFQLESTKQKSRDRNKKFFESMTDDEKRLYTEKARSHIKFESSLEIRVKKSLVELDEDFIQHVFLWSYNFDVAVCGNVLIEVNGDYWHANPRKYKETDVLCGDLTAKKIWEKDNRKINRALENGYRVITIWEDEMSKMNDSQLSEYIKRRIHDARNS